MGYSEDTDKRDVFAPGGRIVFSTSIYPTQPEMIRRAQVKVIAWALSHNIPKSDMFEIMSTLGIHPDQIKNNTGLQQ